MKNRTQIKTIVFGFLILVLSAYQPVFAGTLSIEAKVDQGQWTSSKAIYPLKNQPFQLRIQKQPGAVIQWFQIMPDLSKLYKNANHPWEENPYKWVGFGKIDYRRVELKHHCNDWVIEPAFYSSYFFSPPYYQSTMGSFWLQAVVKDKQGNMIAASPGMETIDHRGLSPEVFRISIRDGEGYLGYVTSFFNVPGVFGSVPYQSYNYIGADCADLLIAAHARWKKTGVPRDYNVAMLVNRFTKVTRFTLNSGRPDKSISWGSTIKPGDLIAVRYFGRRQFQHIGALYRDANEDGKLDREDLVIHAGPRPLQIQALEEGAFDGHVVILRP